MKRCPNVKYKNDASIEVRSNGEKELTKKEQFVIFLLIKMKSLVYLVISISLQAIYCEKARFDNYRVYSIVVDNNEQLQALQELENSPNGLLFIVPPMHNQTSVEIIVPPHKFADISELCETFNMRKELKVENLQRFDL